MASYTSHMIYDPYIYGLEVNKKLTYCRMGVHGSHTHSGKWSISIQTRVNLNKKYTCNVYGPYSITTNITAIYC